MKTLELYIPKLNELDFYQKLLSDKDTMSYNAPWFPPYGCIDFPKSKWESWYEERVNNEPKFFFAYLMRIEDKKFIGYVNFQLEEKNNYYEMGIVILASERGKGYGKEGMSLLLNRAFVVNDVNEIRNNFEKTRTNSYNVHKSAGFVDIKRKEDGYCDLVITKEDYFKNISK